MADYIYLLETRLSSAQRNAVQHLREIAKNHSVTVFLTGEAVRDMTAGSPVRMLEVVVQGNALTLQKDLEAAGAEISGVLEPTQALLTRFPGGVRVDVGSALSVAYPKPGKPVYQAGSILEDLRCRDFTADAMALSLNDGSYGLLMDPHNGVADIEARQLRLVSNYGFIEEPVRMIRAARLMARLDWTLEERTQTRYETGKEEDYIAAMSDAARGFEAEAIVHEEDALRVLNALEAEGWTDHLFPFWTASKANAAEYERLREMSSQLQVAGVHADPAAASFPLLTAKLTPAEASTLKASFPRKGFVREIEMLEAAAKEFSGQLTAKANATPSATWKLVSSANPEAVLWAEFTAKGGALQARFKSFHADYAQARQRIPYALLQEMRIAPELPGYEDLLQQLTFQFMDGHLGTTEELKVFLEPYSPPAPPPPVSVRRARGSKREGKGAKGRGRKGQAEDPEEDEPRDRLDDDQEENSSLSDEGDESEDDEVEELSAFPGRRSLSHDLMERLDEDEDGAEEEFQAPRKGLSENLPDSDAKSDDRAKHKERDEHQEHAAPEATGSSPEQREQKPETAPAGDAGGVAKKKAAKGASSVAPKADIKAKVDASAKADVQSVVASKAEKRPGGKATGSPEVAAKAGSPKEKATGAGKAAPAPIVVVPPPAAGGKGAAVAKGSTPVKAVAVKGVAGKTAPAKTTPAKAEPESKVAAKAKAGLRADGPGKPASARETAPAVKTAGKTVAVKAVPAKQVAKKMPEKGKR